MPYELSFINNVALAPAWSLVLSRARGNMMRSLSHGKGVEQTPVRLEELRGALYFPHLSTLRPLWEMTVTSIYSNDYRL